MTAALLDVVDLHKHFGGIVATDGVNLSVQQGFVHAIIGPNGAGKTTLISQLCGQLKPDRGDIVFNGDSVVGLNTARRARAGLARSFQITSVVMPMTVLDNVMLAVQATQGHSFRFWSPVHRDAGLRDEAEAFMVSVGLAERAKVLATNLSHGEQRQLEVAMALALQPKLLLLDEPMAGMGKRGRAHDRAAGWPYPGQDDSVGGARYGCGFHACGSFVGVGKRSCHCHRQRRQHPCK